MALNSKEQYAMATHVKSSLGSNSPSICILELVQFVCNAEGWSVLNVEDCKKLDEVCCIPDPPAHLLDAPSRKPTE